MYEKWIPIENIPSTVSHIFTMLIKDDIDGLRILLDFHDYSKILKISPKMQNIKFPYRVCEEELVLLQNRNLPLNDDNSIWRYFYKLKKSYFISEFYNTYGNKFTVEHYCIFLEDCNFEFLSFADNLPYAEWIDKD
jgi:hypothetical protein